MSLYSNLPPSQSKSQKPGVVKLKADSWTAKTLFASTTLLKPRAVSTSSAPPVVHSSASTSSTVSNTKPASSPVSSQFNHRSVLKRSIPQQEHQEQDDTTAVAEAAESPRPKKKKRVSFSTDTKKEDATGPNKYHIIDIRVRTPSNQSPLASLATLNGEIEMTPSDSFKVYTAPIEEYDPAHPNDYEAYCKERLMKQRLKAQEDKIEALSQQAILQAEGLKKEQKLNLSGEEAYLRRQRMSQPNVGGSSQSSSTTATTTQSVPTQSQSEPEQPAGKGIGLGRSSFGSRMLSKMGWKDGEGLGKKKQGIQSCLVPGAFNKLSEADRRLSTVMCIMNMVGRGEADPDLASETIQECSRYGDVENCVVYQNPNDLCPEDEAVIIYVKFQFEVDCEKAIHAMNGRYFGGRTVKAYFYDEELYHQRQFS